MSVRLSGPPPEVRGSRIDTSKLRARAQKVLEAVGQARAELSLALVDDEQMTDLNRRYRGMDGPTDVLSFSLLEGASAPHRGRLLGDVVIGIEAAARQAGERHRALEHEVTKLLVHGVLHLLGHDHEKPEDARTMQAEERRVLRSLGVTR
jgi:probable rRNA maturation factor